LYNNTLLSEINDLTIERDALYKAICLKEEEAKTAATSDTSDLSTEKVPRRQQKTNGDSNKRMIVETALHVIKGAVVKVLKIPTARTTMGVHFSDQPWRGAITIGNCADGKLCKIDANVKQQIEDTANECIRQNVACTIHEGLSRTEAESKFGHEMYDFYAVPDSVEKVNVLEIKDWNINCTNKMLCKSTAELMGLIVRKTKFNGKKKQLTIEFTVGPQTKCKDE